MTEEGARVTEKDLHYYEPAIGTTSARSFNASSRRARSLDLVRDAKGNVNLAPYSFSTLQLPPADHRLFLDLMEGQRRNIQETRVRLESRDHGFGAADECTAAMSPATSASSRSPG